MFPMVSKTVETLNSPYFLEVISSVTMATSRYLFGDPAERDFLFDELLLATEWKVINILRNK